MGLFHGASVELLKPCLLLQKVGYIVNTDQGAPPDPSYPRIVSKYLTLDYTSKICRQVWVFPFSSMFG